MFSAAVWTVAGFAFLVNLPFGFWRNRLPRFSKRWFLAVHAPVPLIFALRLLFNVGLRVRFLPLFVGAYFAGQYLGGRIRGSGGSRKRLEG